MNITNPPNAATPITSHMGSGETKQSQAPHLSVAGAAPGFVSTLTQVESQRLVRQFNDAVEQHPTIDGFLGEACTIVSEHSDCLALWISKRDEQGQFQQIHAISDDSSAVWQLVENVCRQITHYVVTTRQICSTALENHHHHQIIAAPVTGKGQVEYILYGCFSDREQTLVRQQWLFGIFSQAFQSWFQTKKLEQSEIKSKGLNDALMLIQSLDQTTDIRQASMAIVNHLRRLCEAEQVSINICRKSDVGELTAISDVETVELSSESNKLINHACNQAIAEKSILVYPSVDNENSSTLLPLAQYCKSNRLQACINFPLITKSGTTLGALLIASSEAKINQPGYVDYISRVGQMMSGHLDIVLRANRGVRDLAISRLKKLKTSSWTKPILIGLGVLIGIMCLPMPYRVACDCELQPIMRRFIAAPYAGILEKTLVLNGDVVSKGQVLANMDGRQLRIELAGLRAERDGAQKKRDSALAKTDYAAAQIALSEKKRFESEIELLEQRVVNLEIRSPIDGIIVSGDLEKVEGAPLELGQTLFEVGPLDQMLAEVAIPESEIQYVKAGMPVLLKLNSFPFKKWEGEIQKIHPRTEIVNDETVFVAQVNLPNDELLLRPGLKGTAKVRAKAYPIGWNLFHRSWETIRYWMIW